MKTMRMLLALTVAVPLAAQQPDSAKKPAMPMGEMMGPGMMHGEMMQGGMMGMQGMMGPMMGHMSQMMEMMGPMMRGMGFNPANLLMHKDALNLTDQQVAKLTALRDAAKTAQDAAMAEAKTHMGELQQAFQANAPDTAALRHHFLAAHAAMGNAHFAQLRAAAQAKALLTDTQRGRVEGWMDAMEQMGSMMRREHQEAPEHGEHHPNR
jgi:Spy/CpxP family protein refolding chaperone